MSNTIDTSALLTQLRGMAREAGVPAASLPAGGVPASGSPDAARTASFSAALETMAGATTGGLPLEGTRLSRAADVDFTGLLRHSLEGVNERSGTAKAMREAFESGRDDVQLVDVMLAAQKARVSFETLTQVRNKMVAAYKDIMSTPL